MWPTTSEAHDAHMLNNDDLTKVLVRERQRDLARIATNQRFARLVRRGRRERNPRKA